jgi:hypothetical protein
LIGVSLAIELMTRPKVFLEVQATHIHAFAVEIAVIG